MFVAGQAVDGRRFEAVAPQRDGVPALAVRRPVQAHKGIETLLDAFAEVAPSGARLRIAGNGPLEGLIRDRAARIPRSSSLGLRAPGRAAAGAVARPRLVLPSVTTALDREPWGLVVNEAMHAGLPVVASDAVGAAAGGLVRDGRNGFVVAERDVAALAAAMRRLIDDAPLARRLGDQARRDVREFDYQRMAGAFQAAVDHAVAARRR